MGKKLKEWAALGERLRAASPAHFDRTLALVRQLTEAKETLAEHDHLLPLRAKRTLKRYIA